jgi:hypothetical protein
MSAPQGTDLQIGWGFEKQDNVWTAINNFFRAKSATGLTAKRTYDYVANMDPSNQKLGGVPVKAEIAPKFDFNPDVDSIVKILAHFCRKYAITDLTGAYRWAMSPWVKGDADPASYIDSLAFEATDGDGYPVLSSGNRLSEIALTIAANKLQAMQLSFMGCFESFTDDATGSGATYTGKPIVRGNWGAAAGPLKIKCTAVAGGGFDGTVKCTTATYAGSTTIPIKFDIWYRVILDDASRLGVNRYNDLWFCFPSSGATALAVNDEFTFANARTLATASFSAKNPLQAAGVDLSVGGVLYPVHNCGVKLMAPKQGNFTNGSFYSQTTQRNGPYAIEITIDRDREDRTFLQKLISGANVAAYVEMFGDPIGATAFDERWKINVPAMQVTDDNRDVSTANTLPEKITLMGLRSGTTNIFDMTVDCGVATI